MPRTFTAASSHKIDLALGSAGSITAAVSVFALVKPATDGVLYGIVSIGQSPHITLERDTSNRIGTNFNGTRRNSTTTFVVADGWALVGFTKAAGTTTARCHIYKYAANTWVHEAASNTNANVTPGGTGSGLGYTVNAGTRFFNGDIAIAGAWAAALTDAQVESLAFSLPAWFQVQPNGLWILDQSSTGLLVNDLTGNGANQSGITGTAVSTATVPVFSYGAPIIDVTKPGSTVTGTSAQTLAAFTSTASGSTVTGTSAPTLAAFTSSASGSTVTGTSAQTLAAFTSSASGGHGPSGTSAQTLGAFTSSASGGTGPSGTSAQTMGAFTSSASGGFDPSGTSAQTMGAFTGTASGGTGPSGTSAQTVAAFTSNASGTAENPATEDANECSLLTEDGRALLTESGDALIIEECVTTTETQRHSGIRYDRDTIDRLVLDAQLEFARRDDEEVLLCL